jgi:hypothetical protein
MLLLRMRSITILYFWQPILAQSNFLIVSMFVPFCSCVQYSAIQRVISLTHVISRRQNFDGAKQNKTQNERKYCCKSPIGLGHLVFNAKTFALSFRCKHVVRRASHSSRTDSPPTNTPAERSAASNTFPFPFFLTCSIQLQTQLAPFKLQKPDALPSAWQ